MLGAKYSLLRPRTFWVGKDVAALAQEPPHQEYEELPLFFHRDFREVPGTDQNLESPKAENP